MRKIVKILSDVNSVNDFKEVEEVTLVRGNASNLYFRLFAERTDGTQRYIPQGTSVQVEVQFDHLDKEYLVRRAAQQAFTGDGSIWYVPILSQDQLMFNSMRVVVTEDLVRSNYIVETDIATEDVGDRRRFT